MARGRLSVAQREIFYTLRTHPDAATGISYDRLSAEVGYDRQHTIASVNRLAAMGKIRILRGGPNLPNRYLPED